MRRCIVFMCAFLALTACSPRSFTGERAVRTSSISDAYDSIEPSRKEAVIGRSDVASVASKRGEALTEEVEKVKGAIDGFMPWYVYAIALVGALVIGIGLAMRGKRFKAFGS